MESSAKSRSSEIGEDVMVILVTVAQLIFFTRLHRYISWPVTGPDGAVTRLSMLTDGYFTWLPIVIVASILVILALIVTMIWANPWYRQAAWVGFCFVGITVVVSLLVIFPFDFSVLPNARAVEVVPKVVTVVLILQATFYAVAAVVLFVGLGRLAGKKETE